MQFQITFGDFMTGYVGLLTLIAVMLVAANYRIEQRRKRDEEGKQ